MKATLLGTVGALLESITSYFFASTKVSEVGERSAAASSRVNDMTIKLLTCLLMITRRCRRA